MVAETAPVDPEMMSQPTSHDLLRYRRRVAQLEPARGRARCPRCWIPWGDHGNRRFHAIWYTPRLGVSVLCEWCWPQCGVEERLLYAAALVYGVWSRSMMPSDLVAEWNLIKVVVEDGPA